MICISNSDSTHSTSSDNASIDDNFVDLQELDMDAARETLNRALARRKKQHDLGPWETLQPSPQKWFSRPIMIDDTTFITASDKTDAMTNDQDKGVLSYNTVNNEWSMYFRYPVDVPLIIDYPTIHLDREYNLLYVHSDGGVLLIIDTVSRTFQIVRMFQAGSYAHCFTLRDDDRFHLLGGYDSNKHLTFDELAPRIVQKAINSNNSKNNAPDAVLSESTNEVRSEGTTLSNVVLERKSFHQFTDFVVCEGAAFIHCESAKMLLFFGGYDKCTRYRENHILETYKVWKWEYEVENSKWTHFKNMRMPGHLRQFGFAITANERFVFLSGGRNLITGINTKTIYVMDLEEGTIRQSNVLCPVQSVWHAIVVPQNPMDRVLIEGYLRDSKLPIELIDVVLSSYSGEHMHLLKDHEHFRISTNILLER